MRTALFLLLFITIACKDKDQEKNPNLNVKQELPKELNEISGMAADGDFIWAITDKPKSQVFKIDKKGNLLQEINIKGVDATDVEAVTDDDQFIYIGDVGDNEGGQIRY